MQFIPGGGLLSTHAESLPECCESPPLCHLVLFPISNQFLELGTQQLADGHGLSDRELPRPPNQILVETQSNILLGHAFNPDR